MPQAWHSALHEQGYIHVRPNSSDLINKIMVNRNLKLGNKYYNYFSGHCKLFLHSNTELLKRVAAFPYGSFVVILYVF